MDNPILESLKNDFAQVKEILRTLAERVVQEGISDYPIFVASREWIEIGKPLISREDLPVNWYFFASMLEEFQKRKLIDSRHLQQFKRAYGEPDDRACIFMVVGEQANFVFIPYEAGGEEEEGFDLD